MRYLSIIFALLTPILVTVAAPAVTVDFGAVGAATDITLPEAYTLGDVTFSYDNFESGADSATVDSGGLSGTTGGVLILSFSVPAVQMSFYFSLLNVSGPVDDGLFVILKNGGGDVGDIEANAVFTPGSADAVGSLSYQGAAFDQAFIYFSDDAPRFSVPNLTYNAATAPRDGDANGDGHVDSEDLLMLVGAFGTSVGDEHYDPACDFDHDGFVDAVDLLTLVYNFGS